MTQLELKQIFQNPYERKAWLEVLKNVFSKVSIFAQPQDLFQEVDAVIEGSQIGLIQLTDDKNIAIFEVEVADNISILHNRKGLRDIAAKHIDQGIIHGALVFFYSQCQSEYRFTFIAKHTEFDDEGNLNKIQTHPKRYTYVLGTPYCGTAVQRISNLAVKNQLSPLVIKDVIEAFSVEALTKEFYSELSNWYFWALQNVTFPDDFEPDEEVRNATSTIRLITRLMFVWFLKQKGLIPDELFDPNELSKILKFFNPKNPNSDNFGSIFYKAILQNLFFATLNQEMGKRAFRREGEQYNITNIYRYKSLFSNPNEALKYFENIPFLNGGLFECLDKPHPTQKTSRGADVVVRIDGFSDRDDNKLSIPDYLFFGGTEHADLNNAYGDSSHGNTKVRGLIEILKSYNFTIEENTPYEIEVALDPELLGKVFENLLASYNPETKTTARKQTGSFYTPREIVNYMVDESLIAYLKNCLDLDLQDLGINGIVEKSENRVNPTNPKSDNEGKLRQLLAYNGNENPFDEKATALLIKAIDNCKILDPACGSGAFPMGVLQKLVHILQKLDKDNHYWKQTQEERAKTENAELIKRVEQDKEHASQISFEDIRKKILKELDERLKEITRTFDTNVNEPDYARKLFLIENCIYGVDIQPIAVQIAKLRFFISLVTDQKIDNSMPNRGILVLPNLETKFVAANTLIGLIKTNTAKPLSVYPLETELKEVRHKHFSARTPETKKKYREQDLYLRHQISTELIKVGFPPTSANQISTWNPYDQNTSAVFFDTEWMFGLLQGFDIVIGNPPYKILTKNNSIELTEYSKVFKSFKNSNSKNLYILFIEKALQLVQKKGTLCYIVPEGLFKTRSYSSCVELLEKAGQIQTIVTFTDYVFENAVTGSLIFVFNNDQKGLTQYYHFDKYFNIEPIVQTTNPILSKIESNTKPLNIVSSLFKGMVVKDRETVIRKENIGQSHIFLLGKNIAKWSVTSMYYTNYSDLEIVGGTKKIEKHNQSPRILIRRTGDNLCCAFLDIPALTESTLYSCWSISSIDNKTLIGLLNSKLLNYYNRELNITNQQGFPQILMTDLENLPINIPKNQQPFITLVDRILTAKKADPQADTLLWEAEIDARVFQLYGLTEEEVLQVLGSLPSVSEGERREIQAQWHLVNKEQKV